MPISLFSRDIDSLGLKIRQIFQINGIDQAPCIQIAEVGACNQRRDVRLVFPPKATQIPPVMATSNSPT